MVRAGTFLPFEADQRKRASLGLLGGGGRFCEGDQGRHDKQVQVRGLSRRFKLEASPLVRVVTLLNKYILLTKSSVFCEKETSSHVEISSINVNFIYEMKTGTLFLELFPAFLVLSGPYFKIVHMPKRHILRWHIQNPPLPVLSVS